MSAMRGIEKGRAQKEIAAGAAILRKGNQPAHWTMLSLFACGSGKVRCLSS